MAIATYTKTGNKATTTAKLDKTVFGVSTDNHELMKQAYVTYMANGRGNNAVTKQRGQVSGGGRKPWKQKGTGRARFGSSRNPLWRGGGIAFGPTGEENYSLKMNVKAKRVAIRQALSMASVENRIVVMEDFAVKDNKTAEATKLLAKVGATARTLLVVDNKTAEIERATRNLQNVTLVSAKYVNVFDVINADHIIVTTKALQVITEWLKPTAGGTK